MSVFLKFFCIKLLLGTVFILIWLHFFPSTYAFFHSVVDSYDSLRYNHDAYVFAGGNDQYYGEILTNPAMILYGGMIYKLTFFHPWCITFFNSVISSLGSWILYKSLLPFLSCRKMKEIFWLSQLMPVFIAYEAILGKELFYLTGFKLLLASLIYLFYYKKGEYSLIVVMLMLFLVIVLSSMRSILLPFLILGLACYYLKPKWLLLFTLISASLAFITISSFQMQVMIDLNHDNGSSSPVFQFLRVNLLTASPFINLISGFFRFVIYLIYPFPLVLPHIFNLGNNSEQMCTGLLTISEQLNFFWELGILVLINKIPVILFSAQSIKVWQYLFWLSISYLLFFSYSFPLLHARYRIFFFVPFICMTFIIKKLDRRVVMVTTHVNKISI